ncbi:anaphase-promoting complex, cyclosome, subunit 4-domain-containing protein [Stachybotrys elegans]|uniref:Anaphase-promoting complex subunit 4 n=1 Tax=Stachybotrys elegans TaxID=80388 RepID=A0A8K0SRM8_9HYPO|nr:anaphase-promoting complex, cyclosome, subunit 4-domain-containing protein [Stachybotrys elegans]
MAQTRELSQLSQTELDNKAPDGFPVSCPTLDLLATWDDSSKHLFIQRPPGQYVSKIHQYGSGGAKAPDALTVTWKPDGQFLAVGWSDGVVRLMGLENNKAAHHIQVCNAAEAKIIHIGWSSCKITNEPKRPLPKQLAAEAAKGIGSGMGESEDLANLPRELTFLEVDTALPKISPLPSSTAGAGEDALVFTVRTGIDFLFQTLKPADYDQINIMVVGTSNGKLQLSIYDSFVLGTFSSPTDISPTSQLIHHTSHPQVTTHVIALADKPKDPETVHLVPMDLPFVSSTPINLPLLASKLTGLQKLLRYLKQTQLHMQVEWKNSRELPSRFLRSVQGDLENMERGPTDIVTALYHTAVTGHVYPPVREWLVDSLAERGHKRWDKAVASALENLRGLVHENFLPALDRCAIILSRLRGLVQFHGTQHDIGFTGPQVAKVEDSINSLYLVGHRILVLIMDELSHFTSFSTWLRFQIDRLATSSSTPEELTEKEATMDNAKVLEYIKRYTTSSPLDMFFDEINKEDYAADLAHIESGTGLLTVLDKQLKKMANGQPSMRALLHVEFLVDYAVSRSNLIFKDVAEAKKRSVRFGKGVYLKASRPISQLDVRMHKHDGKHAMVYAALTLKDDTGSVHISRHGLRIINGISDNLNLQLCRVTLGGRKLVQMKFLNETSLILLCSEQDGAYVVISVPVQSGLLPYAPKESFAEDSPSVGLDGFPEIRIPQDKALRPVHMEVHDKSDVRGSIPARICLLNSSRTVMRTFVIPEDMYSREIGGR